MKRLHVHISVDGLEPAIQFYNTLFNQQATVVKDDYAKWMLDDPAINFAISDRGNQPGLNHLGIQVESDEALEEISTRLTQANIGKRAELDAQCCYAHSNKYWTKDPAGIPWENFHTMGEVKTFNGDDPSQPEPVAMQHSQGESAGERCCS